MLKVFASFTVELLNVTCWAELLSNSFLRSLTEVVRGVVAGLSCSTMVLLLLLLFMLVWLKSTAMMVTLLSLLFSQSLMLSLDQSIQA